MPEEMGNKIMHMSLPISKETIIAGSDTGCEWAADYRVGNNFSISIAAGTKEKADRLFNDLSAGGKITEPIANTFWGSYFGMLIDKFGINWMMNFALQ